MRYTSLRAAAHVNYGVVMPREPKSPKTLPVSFRFAPELKAALETAAAADERSVSNLVERIIREWLVQRGYQVGR